MTHHPSFEHLDRSGHANALADLLSYLPRLVHDSAGQIDVTASDPVLVALVAQTAAGSAVTLRRGIEVIGDLLGTAHAEHQGALQPQAVDALGVMIAEIVNLSTALTQLSSVGLAMSERSTGPASSGLAMRTHSSCIRATKADG